MERNVYSDYGSGSSKGSSWGSLDSCSWPSQSLTSLGATDTRLEQNTPGLLDLMLKRNCCTLAEMMEEFKMNGFDSPYNPEEDKMISRSGNLIGLGPPSVYLRQKSWPACEATPPQRLPRPKSEWIPSPTAPDFVPAKFHDDIDIMPTSNQLDTISAEQVRVLNSLPNDVLYGLLKDLEQERNETRPKNKRTADECRFCKNNGERESYYRTHALKDAGGRVTCPVLRKFVCKRCGARGDRAHTIKYCPFSTDEERLKSAAMMRSVRLQRVASGRRRPNPLAPDAEYVVFGNTSPSALRDFGHFAPLDPLWAELEAKLSL